MFTFNLNNDQPVPENNQHPNTTAAALDDWSSDDEDDSHEEDEEEVEPELNAMMLANAAKMITQVKELNDQKLQDRAQLIEDRERMFCPGVVKESKDQIASALNGVPPTTLEPNSNVEVISHDMGTEGFRWEATTIKHEHGKHLIEYNHRYLPDSQDRMTEWVFESRVRPIPPEPVYLSVAIGDRVEVQLPGTSNVEMSYTWRPATVVGDENTEDNNVLVQLDRSQVQHIVALEKATIRLRTEWTGQVIESTRLSRAGQSWGWVGWPTLRTHKSKGGKKRKRKSESSSSSGGGGGGGGSSAQGLGNKRKKGSGGGGHGGDSSNSSNSSSSSSKSMKKKKKKKKKGSAAWKSLAKFRNR